MPIKEHPEPPLTAVAGDSGYMTLKDLRELVDQAAAGAYPETTVLFARTKGFKGRVVELTMPRPVRADGTGIHAPQDPGGWGGDEQPGVRGVIE